jgi:hypothetical protein
MYVYIYFSKNPAASIYKQIKKAVRSTECLSVPNRQDSTIAQKTVTFPVMLNTIM